MSKTAEVGRGGLLLSVGNLTGAFLGFLNTLLLTRLLGGDLYGVYSRVITFSFLAMSLLNLGEAWALFRFIPDTESKNRLDERKILFSSALFSRMFYSGIAGFTFILLSGRIAAYIGREDLTSLILLSGLLVFISPVAGLIYSLPIALRMEGFTVVFKVVMNGLICLLTGILLKAGQGVRGALISQIIGNVAAVIVFGMYFVRLIGFKLLKPHEYLKNDVGLIVHGLPMAMLQVSMASTLEVPLTVFSSAGSDIDNAILRASNRYFFAFYIILSSFGTVLIPHLTSKIKNGEAYAFNRYIGFFSFLSCGVLSILIGLSGSLLQLLSPTFTDRWVLSIMGLSFPLMFILPLNMHLAYRGEKKLIGVAPVMLGASFVASYLMKGYGVRYVAMSYPISLIVWFSLILLISGESLSVNSIMRVVLALCSAAISGMLGYIIDSSNINLYVRVPSSALIVGLSYYTLTILLGIVGRIEAEIIEEMMPDPLSRFLRFYYDLLAR